MKRSSPPTRSSVPDPATPSTGALDETSKGKPIASEPSPTIGRAEGQHGGGVLSPEAAIEMVRAAVAGWKGVTTHDHLFGGIEFRLGLRELGHLHGTIADLPFPRPIRDALVAAGRARPHHVLPESGWVTLPMQTASEVSIVIELFRQNYDRD